MKDFKDKVAVVTGAGSGLGRALASQLHRDGAHLALLDINPVTLEETAHLLKAQPDRVSLHAVDVGSGEQMKQAALAALDRHERVDLLINNAGIARPWAKFEDVPEDHFVEIIRVNLWGVYNGIRVFLPHLKRRPQSSIVNISSLAGLVALRGCSPYVMSKFAVRGLSEALQVEGAGAGVHVLVVYPGGIKTNLTRNIPGLDESAREAAIRSSSKYARLTPEGAASKILRAVRNRRRRLILGSDAKVAAALRPLSPAYSHWALRAMAKWFS
jgi:NAD(P)-dependent dehydrogenase (short-subunit alcohol dehydrogenase family)